MAGSRRIKLPLEVASGERYFDFTLTDEQLESDEYGGWRNNRRVGLADRRKPDSNREDQP